MSDYRLPCRDAVAATPWRSPGHLCDGLKLDFQPAEKIQTSKYEKTGKKDFKSEKMSYIYQTKNTLNNQSYHVNFILNKQGLLFNQSFLIILSLFHVNFILNNQECSFNKHKNILPPLAHTRARKKSFFLDSNGILGHCYFFNTIGNVYIIYVYFLVYILYITVNNNGDEVYDWSAGKRKFF